MAKVRGTPRRGGVRDRMVSDFPRGYENKGSSPELTIQYIKAMYPQHKSYQPRIENGQVVY